MGIVSVVLLIIFIIACLLVVLVVLLQDEQGEGLGGIFGGSSASFGPRRGNVLTRFTTIVGAAFMIGAFALAWLNRTPEAGDVARKARLEKLKTEASADWFVESSPTAGATATSGDTAAATTAQGTDTASGTQDATGTGAQGATAPESTTP
jgi:preprotein translocase subunit SecG